MTVSLISNRNDYVGTDAVSVYNYSFRIVQQGDLTVQVQEIATGTETTLAITTDYTVAGVGADTGGSITLVDASQAWLDGSGNLSSDYKITIRRIVDLTQETDIRNQGDFFPEAHEDQFDKHTFIDQQQQEELDRTVKIAETVPASDFDGTIPPDLVGVDGVAVITNPAGDGFIVGPTADAISNAQANATAAAASAAAAATSETNAATSETNAATSETNAAASEAAAAASAASINGTKYTNAHTAFQTAATTNEIELVSLPANEVMVGILIKHSVLFAGTGITDYNISVGLSGETDRWVFKFDVTQAVADSAQDSVMFLYLGSVSSTTSIRITAESVGANLDQSTAGSVDVWTFTRSLA